MYPSTLRPATGQLSDSDYLFPQLSEQLKCISEHSLLAKYNKALARISKQADLSKAATSYIAVAARAIIIAFFGSF